jgi:phosphatidylglycerol---prolipoprotein diacylglyceryl transferase
MFYIFKKDGKSEKDVESLTFFMVIATVLGARLGHCLFYEPEVYLANPLRILKVWEGGLASHGAAVGILTALFLYVNYFISISFFPPKAKAYKRKREGQSYLWVVDRIVIVVALTGCLIRFGNFMNSEIIGKPSESDFGIVFAHDIENRINNSSNAISEVKVRKSSSESEHSGLTPLAIQLEFKEGSYQEADVRNYLETSIKTLITSDRLIKEHLSEVPNEPLDYTFLANANGTYTATINSFGINRHPAQLYESISCLILFIILFAIWAIMRERLPEGLIFSIFLVVLFGLRFLYEYLKENQVAFEDNLALNMGQWLSIPLVLAGVVLFVYVLKNPKRTAIN